jgi:hypothetical protein
MLLVICAVLNFLYKFFLTLSFCRSFWTLSRKGATPVAEIGRTRKSSSEMANTHFSWLKTRPLAAKKENNTRGCVQCCYLDLLEIPSSSKKERKTYFKVLYLGRCRACVVLLLVQRKQLKTFLASTSYGS